MSYFAELDENNVVNGVIRIDDINCHDENGVESDEIGNTFIHTIIPNSGRWIRTSYNSSMRKHYAGVGYTYEEARDIFIPAKQYPSWILDEDIKWNPPTPYPDDDTEIYTWDETTTSWIIQQN